MTLEGRVPDGLPSYRFRAARTASHRRFVASIIAFRPAALSLRFLRAGAEVLPDSEPAVRFAAHLFRCAAAILARAAADIRRRLVVGADDSAPSLLAPPLNICRSSATCPFIRFFCSSKPSMAAVISSRLSFGDIELTSLYSATDGWALLLNRFTSWEVLLFIV
jgi:hypothetical protein